MAMSGMGHAPGNYQPISTSELRLGCLPSSSEYREEALSFSTLPTSQFALKPSSSDMDLSDQQHSLLVHNRSCIDALLEPYSWSWVQNARLNPLHLRRTIDHGSSTSGGGAGSSSSSGGGGGHPHPSSAPTNYHGGTGGSSVVSSSPHHHQPVQGSLSSANEPRDISRSSLSVTSSKTIILSNAPVSHAPPTTKPTPSTASASTTSTTASTTSASKTTPVAVPSKGVASQLTNQSQMQAQQLATARRATKSSSNASPAQQRQDGTSQPHQGQPSTKPSAKKEDKMKHDSNNKVIEKKTAIPPGQKSEGATTKSRSPSASRGQSSTAESAVLNPPSTTGDSTAPMKAGELKSATSGVGEPMDTSPSSGTPKKASESTANSQSNAEKLKSGESKNSVKKVEDGESSKALSAWMINKPAASILQLSRPRKRKREEKKSDGESSPKTKIQRTLVASAEAALLITSQFARQIVKKEETAQPLTVTHALNSAVVGIAGARNAATFSTAGMPISTADVSAVSHNITKIPLSVATTPVMQNAAAKLLSLDSIQPLQSQQAQQQQQAVAATIMNSVPDGVSGGHLAGTIVGQDKKAVVNAVSASGQAQALSTNLAVRRSSTGTNGTNSYQEIYHTERMKQALAG